jgi:hypothetical protein
MWLTELSAVEFNALLVTQQAACRDCNGILAIYPRSAKVPRPVSPPLPATTPDISPGDISRSHRPTQAARIHQYLMYLPTPGHLSVFVGKTFPPQTEPAMHCASRLFPLWKRESWQPENLLQARRDKNVAPTDLRQWAEEGDLLPVDMAVAWDPAVGNRGYSCLRSSWKVHPHCFVAKRRWRSLYDGGMNWLEKNRKWI